MHSTLCVTPSSTTKIERTSLICAESGTIQESIDGQKSSGAGLWRTQETSGHMKAVVDSAEFRHEVLAVQILTKRTCRDRCRNKLAQVIAPGNLLFEQGVSDCSLPCRRIQRSLLSEANLRRYPAELSTPAT